VQALQDTLTAAILEWVASMVAVCSAVQLVRLARPSSLHILKSTIALAILATDEASDAALQRVKVAAA
jgi:hypothetical protein